MIQHKIKAKSLASDFQSEQFSLSQKTFSGKNLAAQSVQIVWNGLSGAFNGTLEIWASAGNTGAVKLVNYTPLGADNLQNAIIFFITQPYAKIYIKYIANGNISGRLDMYLNFSNTNNLGI